MKGTRLTDLYDQATTFIRFNDRGFSPFQFSSRMTQMNTGQLGGLLPGNVISDLVNERYAWYEMWINPEKVDISRQFQQKRQHTAAAIVTYHYRPEVEIMKASGVCGWIAIEPQKDKDDRSLGFSSKASKKDWAILNVSQIWKKSSYDASKLNPAKRNSPRIFLERLRNIATEPMYFVDLQGLEHYNIKYVKIFTKQYPDGMICEGYYTDFDVPESGEDAQTVNYSFTFVIERKVPVKDLKEMLGMFGTTPALAKGSLSAIPGISGS